MMGILQSIADWAKGFFGLDEVIRIIHTGDYASLKTLNGVLSIVGPILPIFLVLEFVIACLYRKFKVIDYKIPFFSYLLNAFIGRFLSIAAVTYIIGVLSSHAIFKSGFTWYWFIYGYIVWEFGHFIYHFLAHKVRLFWCLHSTHHAPESMNLSVSYAHFFLEAPYADVIRTSTCILLGVNPPLLFLIMFIDGFWGGFIHIGETLGKKARCGPLFNYILTPSHHRVHHGRNPLYMDTNFCNLLNIWDRVFGTYQPESDTVPVEYGITRPLIKNSFTDAYFGEIVLLAKDIAKAPGIKNKFLYLIMPPGWSHTGNHKTARVIRDAELKVQGVRHKA
jgi:sterol desaturase/sphingolipid hydroxylase (fatty acid hydroxylase superfamily)